MDNEGASVQLNGVWYPLHKVCLLHSELRPCRLCIHYGMSYGIGASRLISEALKSAEPYTASNSRPEFAAANPVPYKLPIPGIHIERLTHDTPGAVVALWCPQCKTLTFMLSQYAVKPTDGDYWLIEYCPGPHGMMTRPKEFSTDRDSSLDGYDIDFGRNR